MAQSRTLSSLKPNGFNPRKITAEKKGMLAKTLKAFGDLGGIVYNIRTQQIIGGHQRTEAFAKANPPITITKHFDKPTETGTVSLGYIEMHGERFAYREVDWQADKERAAILAANNAAGSWDMPKVATLLQELDTSGFEMDLTLFDARELEMFSYELPKAPEVYSAREQPARIEGDDTEIEHLPDGPINFTMPSEQGKARGQDRDAEIKAEDFKHFDATCPRCNFAFNPK